MPVPKSGCFTISKTGKPTMTAQFQQFARLQIEDPEVEPEIGAAAAAENEHQRHQ
jgi:hypothetical protein